MLKQSLCRGTSWALQPAWSVRGRLGSGCLVAVVSMVAVRAAADPVTPEPQPELTAADVTGAPAAGDESGRIDRRGGDSRLRRVLRGALFVPRIAVDAVLSPVRLSIWAYDRYQLDELYYRVFFNDARTIGLVPTAAFESGFGVTAGARFVARDLLGRREHLSIEAAGGGRYRQVYKLVLRSGERLGDRLGLELGGQYELRPRDPFYGIGDGDDSAMPAAPVDPARDPTAVETRYRQRIARIAGVLDVRVLDVLHLRSSGELTARAFSASDTGVPITAVYDPAMIVGYDGTRQLYAELELRLDTRRRSSRYEPEPFYSAGSLAAVFGGHSRRLDDARDYWRYGIDLQHFVRLAEGPRVLAMRLRGEAVSGTRSEVPFTELPELGGIDDLRGYPADRFRDRALALGSIEYQWDMSNLVAAGVFVDAGRVVPALDELSTDGLRVGYGLTLQGHTSDRFGFRASLASSIDGGVFLDLAFNPIFALDERVRRR